MVLHKNLLLIIAFVLALAAPAWAAHQELQSWTGVEVDVKGKDIPLKIKIRDEIRLSNYLLYNHLETALSYDLVEGVSIGVGYRAAVKELEGAISSEQRPFLDIKLGYGFISIREQFAYCYYSPTKFEWIFRTKTTLDFGKKYPYGYWEVFIRQADSLYRSRLYLGYRFEVLADLWVDAGAFWQADKKDERWENRVMVCLTVTIKV
jgi:hypothetical protein